MGGELYAASEGDRGRRGGKETSTVNLEDGRDENELDEYDIMLLVSKCFLPPLLRLPPPSAFDASARVRSWAAVSCLLMWMRMMILIEASSWRLKVNLEWHGRWRVAAKY